MSGGGGGRGTGAKGAGGPGALLPLAEAVRDRHLAVLGAASVRRGAAEVWADSQARFLAAAEAALAVGPSLPGWTSAPAAIDLAEARLIAARQQLALARASEDEARGSAARAFGRAMALAELARKAERGHTDHTGDPSADR